MSGSSQSNVGNRSIYEDGDQRNAPQTPEAKKYQAGHKNSHKANDSKDERTIANRMAREEQGETDRLDEFEASKRDPTAPARMHGNEPSRGAKADAEIQKEEEEELRRKGKLK